MLDLNVLIQDARVADSILSIDNNIVNITIYLNADVQEYVKSIIHHIDMFDRTINEDDNILQIFVNA